MIRSVVEHAESESLMSRNILERAKTTVIVPVHSENPENRNQILRIILGPSTEWHQEH
jgi:hypothetical protein